MRGCVFAFFGIAALAGGSRDVTGAHGSIRQKDPVLSVGHVPVAYGSGEGRVTTRDPRCDGQSENRSHRYGPLVCWLLDLKVSIPDEEIKKGFFSVHINDMACTNFEIGSISSSHTKPKAGPVETSDGHGPTISLSISGVSATCYGKYQVAGTSGSIKASVKSIENKPLRLAIGFVSGPLFQGNISVAKSASVTLCEANLQVPEHDGLNFHGSVSAEIIEIFATPIAKHVSSTLSSQLCPTIKSEMDSQISKTLNRTDMYLSGLIQNYNAGNATQTHRLAGMPPDDTIDFESETPLLNDFLLRANGFISRHLNSGFVLDVLNRIGITDGVGCDDCGFFFKGVNGLFKYLTGGSGLMQMRIPKNFTALQNITFLVPSAGVVRIDLQEINVTGLENLTNLTVFQPWSDRNFRSTLASTDVNLTARLNIHIDPVEGGFVQGQTLQEAFDIHVSVSDVDMMGNIMFVLSQEEFSNLTMGDVLSFFSVDGTENVRNPNPLNCLLSTLVSADFSDVRVRLDVAAIQILPYAATSSLHTVTSEQDLEYELDGLLNNILTMFLGEYEILVTESIAALAQGPLRSALNSFIKSTIEGTTGSKTDKSERLCTSPLSGSPTFFQFDHSNAFKQFSSFLDRNLGLSELNSYLTCVSAFIRKSWPSTGVIHNGTYGGFKVVLRDLVMHGDGNLTEFDVMNPEEDSFHLMNRFRFGECGTSAKNMSDCGGDLSSTSVTIDISHPALHGEVNVTARLGDISMEGGTMVLFDTNKFSSMKIIRLLSRLQCAVVPASAFEFYGFAGALGVTELDIDAAVKTAGHAPLSYSLKLGEQEALHNAINSYLVWFLDSIENILNGVSRTALNQASNTCMGEPISSKSSSKTTRESNDHSKAVFWYTFAVAITCIVANFVLCLSRSCKETGNDDMKRDELSKLLLGEEDMPRMEVMDGDCAQSSLMFLVSNPVRHAFPIILFGTMVLFLSSNLSTGASVDLKLSGAEGKSFQLPSIFAFSLGRTVTEMYGAHIYALMLLVVVFSGIWPYLKLILMLFAWATPSATLSVNKRENLLIWLDALGKFSLIDAYVLVLMMVAFRYHLDVPSLGSVDVFVTPMFGFYGFLLATILSLICGHVILLIHRQSTGGWAQAHLSRKESLRQHVYMDDATGRSIRLSKKFQLFLLAALLLTIVLLAVGVGTKSFNFEIGGLAGMALGENRSASYSLVSLGTSIPRSVEDPSFIGIRWIQLTYYFFALVMPFVFLAVIIVVFLCPMNLKVQRWAIVIAEIANAWSAVEVFLLSVVAALMEISTFSEFIIGDRCDFINDVLGRWFDKELHGDDKCFNVKATIGGDSWLLFCGVTLSSFLSFVLLRLAHHSINERLSREAMPNDSEAEPRTDAVGKELKLGPVPFAHGCLGKFLYEDVVSYHEVPSTVGGDANNSRSNRRQSMSSFWEHWRDTASFA